MAVFSIFISINTRDIEKKGERMMKKRGLVLSLLVILSWCSYAHAIILPGPTLMTENNNDMYGTGLQFVALQDVTLTSFVYDNQGKADTIWLTDSIGSILHEYESPESDTLHTIDVSWTLSQGVTYNLIALHNFGTNGMVGEIDMPTGNEHILVYAGLHEYFQNESFQGEYLPLPEDYWYDFTDITTEAQQMPEPTTVTLLSIGIVGLVGGVAIRKLKKKATVRNYDK